MTAAFQTTADVALPASVHAWGCGCALHRRRRALGTLGGGLTLAALAPAAALAQDGVRGEVGRTSRMTGLVPAEQVEAAAAQEYAKLLQEARAKNALAPSSEVQVQRLRAIAQRLIPFGNSWNRRATNWRWEINLIGSRQLNAFCMPGGKIAFYYGILDQLQLSDDEVAAIMGHEMSHALREHAREQMGKSAATQIGVGALSALLGLGNTAQTALGLGGQLLSLRFSREDEQEADLVGMELAARAGYNPEAGITLWEKMMSASRGAPPEFLSTHPSGSHRIDEMRSVMPKVTPLYQRAPKPTRYWGPPGRENQGRTAPSPQRSYGTNPNNDGPGTRMPSPQPQPEWGYDGKPR